MFTKKFQDMDIYTITGHYFGKAKDIILNLKTGNISEISVLIIEDVEKTYEEKGFFEKLVEPFKFPEEDNPYRIKNLVNIDYNRIISFGDVILINI
jgi:sporulation protein YlmC with PRC-barrel domain